MLLSRKKLWLGFILMIAVMFSGQAHADTPSIAKASQIKVDTADFEGTLGPTDTDAQTAFDTIDDFTIIQYPLTVSDGFVTGEVALENGGLGVDASSYNGFLTISGGSTTTISQIDLASNVTGDLPVNNLASGVDASPTTFWRGDGQWVAPVVTAEGASRDNSFVMVTQSSDCTQDRVLVVDTTNMSITDGGAKGNITIGLNDDLFLNGSISLNKDLTVENNVYVIGDIAADNLSGDNTGDQDLSAYLTKDGAAVLYTYTAGDDITVIDNIITNSAPDQTVGITGGGINNVTGVYPSFTVTGTEVDGSVTNELQDLSASGFTDTVRLSITDGNTVEFDVAREMDWGDPVDSNIVPDTDNAYDLGSETKAFNDLWIGNDIRGEGSGMWIYGGDDVGEDLKLAGTTDETGPILHVLGGDDIVAEVQVGDSFRVDAGTSNTVIELQSDGDIEADGTITGYNLSGINTGDQDLSSYLTATGIENYIPKRASNGTLIDSVVYGDGTNIGIGTASPTATLQTQGVADWDRDHASGTPVSRVLDTGTTNSQIISSLESNSSAAGFRFKTNGNSRYWDWFIGSLGEMRFDSYNNSSVIRLDRDAPTYSLTIDDDGNVGIGTDSPNNLIQVAGLINFDDTLLNTALGTGVMRNVNTGRSNVGLGYHTFYELTDGSYNLAIGVGSYEKLTTGSNNIGLGAGAGYDLRTGLGNMFIGSDAGRNNRIGNYNVGIGQSALKGTYANSFSNNVGLGAYAGTGLTTGSYNVFIGLESGNTLSTGASNVFLGYKSGYRQTTNSNLLIIDNQLRADAATEESNAILYGTMAATPADQILRINANVGVGVDPIGGAKVSIRKDGLAGDALLRLRLSSDRDWIFKENDGGGGALELLSSSSKDFYLKTTGWIFEQPSHPNSGLNFTPGSSTTYRGGALSAYSGFDYYFRMANGGTGDYILTADKIGVGTASPDTKLEIQGGDLSVSGTAKISGILSQSGTTYYATVDDQGEIGRSTQSFPVSGGTGGSAVDSVNGETGVVVLDTGDISEVTNKNYVTDAHLIILGNTSNTNTGDQDLSGYLTTETDPVYTAWDKDYDDLSNTPTIPSGNQIIDWTIDQGATNINAGNYTDTDTTYTAGDNLELNGTEFRLADDVELEGTLSVGKDITASGTYYGITDNMVEMDYPSGSTQYTLDDYLNDTQSAGWISGGEFSDDGDGTMTVSAGVGVIKSSISDTGANFLFDFAETALTPTASDITNYVYINYNSGSPVVDVSATKLANGKTIFNLGKVFLEGTTCHFFRAGQVVSNFTQRVLQRLNSDGEVQLKSGGIVSESGTPFTLLVSEATLYGGVIKFTTSEIDTNTAGTFEYYYTDGVGGFQYIGETETLINSTQYDNAGTLTNLPQNDYRTDFAFITNDGDLLAIIGDDNFNKLLEAQNQLIPSSLPSHISEFSTPIAKIIVQQGEAEIVEIRNIIKEDAFSTVGSVVHNDTTGKQGGTTDEYYHMTADEYAGLSEYLTKSASFLGDVTGTYDATIVGDDSHAHTNSTITLASTDLTDTADLLRSADVNTFSELQALVADKTLVNEEDAVTWDSAHTFDSDLKVAGALSPSGVVYYPVIDDTGLVGKSTVRFPAPAGTGTGTPGGDSGQIQVNDSGSFAGVSNLTVSGGIVYYKGSEVGSASSESDTLATVTARGATTTENIGIGVTAPTVALEVSGDISNSGFLTTTGLSLIGEGTGLTIDSALTVEGDLVIANVLSPSGVVYYPVIDDTGLVGKSTVRFPISAGTGTGAVDSVNGEIGVVVLDTGDISEATDANYVTDAQLVVIGNTSNINSGDITLNASAITGGMSLSGQEISNRAATNAQTGYMTYTLVGNIETNNAKNTNVTTNLSLGAVDGTTMVVASSDGTDATLIAATTDDAGLLTAALFDEIAVNTAKVSSQWVDAGSEIYFSDNVGIGTTDPSYRLSVDGDIQGTIIRSSAYPTLTLIDLADSEFQSNSFTMAGASGFNFVLDSNDNSPSNYFNFVIGGFTPATSTELMRLTGDGKLGIGDPTPDAKLDVVGDAIVSTSLTASDVFISNALSPSGTVKYAVIDDTTGLVGKSGIDFIQPGGSGGGYTNLTEFVDQTAWRLFYSDTDGDVTELALGSSGTYLKSNGAAAAPTFATPASGGTPGGDSGQIQVNDSGSFAGVSNLTVSGGVVYYDGDEIATAPAATETISVPTFSARSTATDTISNTNIDVTWNTEILKDTGFTHVAGAVGVEFDFDGWVEILCAVGVDGTSRNELTVTPYVNTGSGYVAYTDDVASNYNTRDATQDQGCTVLAFILEVSDGDLIKFNAADVDDGTDGALIPAQTRLIIKRFDDLGSGLVGATGAKGDTGDTGPAGGVADCSINFVIDGGGSAIATGIKGDVQIPYDFDIDTVTVLADVSGSIVVDIWNDTYANYPPIDGDSITASTPPTITTATKSTDTTLTSWTTALTQDTILRYNVDSCTTITKVTVVLSGEKS